MHFHFHFHFHIHKTDVIHLGGKAIHCMLIILHNVATVHCSNVRMESLQRSRVLKATYLFDLITVAL
jgi:hypothetical protein